MVSIDYVKKEANKFKRTNTATLYKKGNDVYKIIERQTWLYNDIINNISYNVTISNNVNQRIILPTQLITDINSSQIRGYKCRLVNGKNLENLANHLSTEQKILLINSLTSLLKEINEYLVVGDINLGNCMYDKNLNGYLIDFDLSTKIGKEPSLLAYYNFTNSDRKDIKSNLSTDKVKMGIIAASLLYNSNFEDCFVSKKPYSSWNKFLQYTNNLFFKDYFKTAMHHLDKNKVVDEYLFIPKSSNFIKLIEEDNKKIRKLI